jgi:cytoskeleton protein RodZ
MTTPASPPKSDAPVNGPGARLAQARSDLHLDPDQVAARLHLSSRQIQSLEQDDYTGLPGATYVRGYIRSYALLLGLDPAPLLEAHAHRTARQTHPDLGTIAPQKEITSRHHQVRFTTYLVAAIVIGLAIAWWTGREAPPPRSLPTAQEPQVIPATEPKIAAAPAQTEPLPAPASGGVAPAPAVGPAAPAPTQPVTAATSVAAPAAAPVATPPLSGPRSSLVLHAEQDTWADIRDARQVKLLYETVPAGRVVTLEGVAPFNVFLGNAAGARLDYNGRAVDVARHKRGMVARFTLGDEPSAPPTNP